MTNQSEQWKCHDAGNKDRFVAQHGEALVFLRELGDWAGWDGKRWSTVAANKYERAEQTMLAISDEAKRHQLGRKELLSWAAKCLNVGRMDSMLKLAAEPLGASVWDFDTEPNVINCSNGVVNLRTKELTAHAPDQRHLKCTAVEYKPDAKSELWQRYLADVFESNQELIDWLQVAVGYSLTGLTQEECFFVLFGRGRNGKDTFTDAVRAAIGDYACTTDFNVLLDGDATSVRTLEAVGNLRGKRFAVAAEADQNKRFKADLLKSLTGGNERGGAKLKGSAYRYTPTDKLWLLTNHLPRITDPTVAMWERINVVPFNKFFGSGGKRDNSVKIALRSNREHKEAVLAWAIEGAFRYLSDGLPKKPKAVLEAIGDYRKQNDDLSRFWSEYAEETEPNEMLPVGKTHAAYAEWHGKQGISGDPESIKFFRQRMDERGVKAVEKGGSYFFKGYRLKTTSSARPVNDNAPEPRQAPDKDEFGMPSAWYEHTGPNGHLDVTSKPQQAFVRPVSGREAIERKLFGTD